MSFLRTKQMAVTVVAEPTEGVEALQVPEEPEEWEETEERKVILVRKAYLEEYRDRILVRGRLVSAETAEREEQVLQPMEERFTALESSRSQTRRLMITI